MSGSIRETIAGVTVYVPTGAKDVTPKKLARRPASLRGARIGILDNHKEYADVVLRGLAAVLERDYGATVKVWRKTYLGIPSPFAEEMAAQCDAVVNGVGH